jgi:Protein of unknown function (DUF2975)
VWCRELNLSDRLWRSKAQHSFSGTSGLKQYLLLQPALVNIQSATFGGHKMKKRSLVVPTIFLRAVIVLIGIGAVALLLWEPQIEGRNAHATLFEIYFKDPFLTYAYVASIPFFVGLYQTFKVLRYIGQNKAFSQATVKALRTIKYCAVATIGFVAVSVIFIMFADKDDRPAGVFMRILIAMPSIVVATAAAMFERILQNAMDTKSENDLSVGHGNN